MPRFFIDGPLEVRIMTGATDVLLAPTQAEMDAPGPALDVLQEIEGFAAVRSVELEGTITRDAARQLRQIIGWARGPSRCLKHRRR